jgi:hypothetical protein
MHPAEIGGLTRDRRMGIIAIAAEANRSRSLRSGNHKKVASGGRQVPSGSKVRPPLDTGH